ncbi:MAG TPA: hypothetical protein VL728_05995 [Cyclobacteriaceae bacterium]|jgi:hypothetical protein|nr:hypothetical protein [Cyclobacteriaceae bacterium]
METKFLYGDKFTENLEALLNDLIKIQETNQWFKAHEEDMPSDEYNQLYWYRLNWNGYGIKLDFYSKVPLSIRNECTLSFEKHFGKK